MRRLQTRQIKMEVLTVLLVFLTASGYSFILQPGLTVTQITPLDLSEETEKTVESTERRKTEEERSDGLTPERNPEKKRMEEKIIADFIRNVEEILDINKEYERGSEEKLTPETFPKILGEEANRKEFSADVERREDEDTNKSKTEKEILTGDTKTFGSHNTRIQEKAKDDETPEKLKKSDRIDKLKQEIEKEERESRLVAGINLHEETRGDREVISQSQNPPSSSNHHHVPSPSSLFVTPTQDPPISPHLPPPHLLPLSVTPADPTKTHQISVFTAPAEVKSVSLLEDLLTEASQSPGHHLKQNEPEVKASSSLEDVVVKNILFKPAQKKLQATRKINPEFIPKVQAATRKHKEAKFISKDLKPKGQNSTQISDENNSTAKPVELEPNMAQLKEKRQENDTKLTVKPDKASPPRPQPTKPSAKTQLTAKTPSVRPKKISASSKNKTSKRSKDNKRKKDNKTKKPLKKKKKKKVVAPTHFPYFLDDYCPPDCACYGRVVQCSDKGVDKIPYGIPYNSRYILLMNNRIDSIQLDLLNEYVSMEFLVLSNNQLTDGAIEGAFEGIPALKRLYLDRNLLKSVPTDLPVSLEELRLDNNHLSVMSEAAWARCPGLLVLSLSNNSLGNGSDSLPDAALSPLSSLRTLNLDHNQLTSVPLGLPLSIKELYLKGNLIEQFQGGAFNGTSELLVLDLSSNRLTNKGLLRESLLNATYLESLNLGGNRLKQVPRHLPRSLKTLNLEGNLISSIKKAALNTLKNLEHLGLARNKIFKVAPGAFKALPVLHQLDLCHNTLRQVPRQLPQALHSVALSHNRIQSVPRDAFCWGNRSLSLSGLVRVQLEHNSVDMGKLDAQAFRCLRGFQVVHFY